MDRRDAARVLELRQHLWPHTPKADDPASEVDTWASIFARYPAEDVVSALRTMRRAFPPTIGEIEQVLDPWPTPDDVWAEFERQHGRGYSTHEVGNVPWSSGQVRAIAAAGYWRRFGEAPDAAYDEFAPANRANFRKAFAAEVASALAQNRRAIAGLAPPALSEHHPIVLAAAEALPSVDG